LFYPVGKPYSVSPGPRLPPSRPLSGVEGSGTAAIRGHTLSSKGARLSRSHIARAAPHLRNASLPVCRFAAINKKTFLSVNYCSRVRPAEVLSLPLQVPGCTRFATHIFNNKKLTKKNIPHEINSFQLLLTIDQLFL
jgi:hypothetical protein